VINSSEVGNWRDSSIVPSTAPTTPGDCKCASVKDADIDEDKSAASQGLSRQEARPEEEPAEKAKEAKMVSGGTPEVEAVEKKQGEKIVGIDPRTPEKLEKDNTLPRKEAVSDPAKRKAADDESTELGAPETQRIKTESSMEAKVNGIENPNYHCYRNSALQLLASCKPFREELAKHLAGPSKVVGLCDLWPSHLLCGSLPFWRLEVPDQSYQTDCRL